MNRFRHWLASRLYSLAERIDVPFPAVYPWVEVGFFRNPETGRIEYGHRVVDPGGYLETK